MTARAAHSARPPTRKRPRPLGIRPRVALLIETSNTHGRGLIEGVVEYSEAHTRWMLDFCEVARGANPPSWMSLWRGDGIIARVENLRVADAVRASGRPAVDLSAARLIPTLPLVETHDHAIATLIVDHLLDCGIEQFGFLGDTRYLWSAARQAHFEALVERAGFSCSSLTLRPTRNLDREYTRIANWLDRVPKPIGIMSAYDTLAQRLLEVCRAEKVRVPDDAAIASVDNEGLLCQLTSPPLTSVALNSRRMGHLAASLLDRLMSGEKVAPDVYLVEPIGIVCRQSTDILTVDDPLVASAVRFIREHACDGINVEDVLTVVPVSRRILDNRFKNVMQHSVHAEILKVRIRRVHQLLRETNLPLHSIAESTGFTHPEYLSVAFKRESGLWPSQLRERVRRGVIT
jgi:LacI family transcriptional regulator